MKEKSLAEEMEIEFKKKFMTSTRWAEELDTYEVGQWVADKITDNY